MVVEKHTKTHRNTQNQDHDLACVSCALLLKTKTNCQSSVFYHFGFATMALFGLNVGMNKVKKSIMYYI